MKAHAVSRKVKKYFFIGGESAFVMPHYQQVTSKIKESLQKTSRRLRLRLSWFTFVNSFFSQHPEIPKQCCTFVLLSRVPAAFHIHFYIYHLLVFHPTTYFRYILLSTPSSLYNVNLNNGEVLLSFRPLFFQKMPIPHLIIPCSSARALKKFRYPIYLLFRA